MLADHALTTEGLNVHLSYTQKLSFSLEEEGQISNRIGYKLRFCDDNAARTALHNHDHDVSAFASHYLLLQYAYNDILMLPVLFQTNAVSH